MKARKKIKPLKLKRGDRVINSQKQFFSDTSYNKNYGLYGEVVEVDKANGVVIVYYPHIKEQSTQSISDFELVPEL